jgi:hypothetical protein
MPSASIAITCSTASCASWGLEGDGILIEPRLGHRLHAALENGPRITRIVVGPVPPARKPGK